MSRIFWDTMLFIYLLEEHPLHASRIQYLRKRQLERQDTLHTSHLALGELLAGAYKGGQDTAASLKTAFSASSVELLPFDENAASIFGQLRAQYRTSTADSIHLSCAASAGIDLFITADKRLTKLIVPGIHFIANLDTDLF
jgi:predicted nucleic acid-binding protein